MVKRESFSLQFDESWKTMSVCVAPGCRAAGESNKGEKLYISGKGCVYTRPEMGFIYQFWKIGHSFRMPLINMWILFLSLSVMDYSAPRGCQTKKNFSRLALEMEK